MSNKAQLNIALEPERKAEWQQYVDNHGDYQFVTQLVRAAVAKEMRGEYAVTDNTKTTNAGDGRLSDIESILLDIQNGIGDLQDRMDAVEKELEGPSADTTDVAGDVLDVLPSEGMAGRTSHDAMTGEEVPHQDGTVLTGTIVDIADYTDSDPIRVRQALQRLKNDTPLVDSRQVGDDEHFYRTDQ